MARAPAAGICSKVHGLSWHQEQDSRNGVDGWRLTASNSTALGVVPENGSRCQPCGGQCQTTAIRPRMGSVVMVPGDQFIDSAYP